MRLDFTSGILFGYGAGLLTALSVLVVVRAKAWREFRGVLRRLVGRSL